MKNKNKKQSHQLYVLLLNYLLLPVSISNKELKLLMNCQDQRITSIAFFFSFTKITKHALIRRRLYPGQSLIRWVSIIQMVDNHYLQEKVFFRRFPREATSSLFPERPFNLIGNLNW